MKLKQKPEDFEVEEISTIKPKKKESEYSYVLMKKEDWTTIRAIKTIAKRLRVSKVRIGFAGNKDKNAITSQVISIWRVKKEYIERLRIRDIELKFLGYGDERVNLGDLEVNKFRIRLRKVTDRESKTANERIKLVINGFPNYFGTQRFGANENSHLIGKHIILGNFERAVKRLLGKNPGKNWERLLRKTTKGKMERAVLHHLINYPSDYAGALRKIEKPTRRIFVHAYQSWLYNKALSELIGDSTKCGKVDFLDLELNFPLEKISLGEIPILGTETKLGKDKLSKIYLRLLKEENLELKDFECKRMPELASEGTKRVAFVKPKGLKIINKEKDMYVSFELESGAYATMLLSALFLKNVK